MRTERYIAQFSLLVYILKISHNNKYFFFLKDTLGKKNKEYNYKMFDLDWDFMLAQWLVNILAYMVPVATSQ